MPRFAFQSQTDLPSCLPREYAFTEASSLLGFSYPAISVIAKRELAREKTRMSEDSTPTYSKISLGGRIHWARKFV